MTLRGRRHRLQDVYWTCSKVLFIGFANYLMDPSSPAEPLSARDRVLRQRYTAVFSRSPDQAGEAGRRLRRTIDESCRAQRIVLGRDRERLARIFDETDLPLSVTEVWARARDLGLQVSRSHVYVLIRGLVAAGVLIIAENGRAIRYAAPFATRVYVSGSGGEKPIAIEDPEAIERMLGALLRANCNVDGYDLVIHLVARDGAETSSGK